MWDDVNWLQDSIISCVSSTNNKIRPAALLAPLSPAEIVFYFLLWWSKTPGSNGAGPTGRNAVKKRFTDGTNWGGRHVSVWTHNRRICRLSGMLKILVVTVCVCRAISDSDGWLLLRLLSADAHLPALIHCRPMTKALCAFCPRPCWSFCLCQIMSVIVRMLIFSDVFHISSCCGSGVFLRQLKVSASLYGWSGCDTADPTPWCRLALTNPSCLHLSPLSIFPACLPPRGDSFSVSLSSLSACVRPHGTFLWNVSEKGEPSVSALPRSWLIIDTPVSLHGDQPWLSHCVYVPP